MKRVVVTVKREGEARVQDLEIPVSIPVSEWLPELIEALGWDKPDDSGQGGAFRLVAFGPRTSEEGIPLADDSTLLDAGVRDGFWLVGVRQPIGREAPVEGEKTAQPQPSIEPADEPSVPAEGKPRIGWIRISSQATSASRDRPSAAESDLPDWTEREIEDL